MVIRKMPTKSKPETIKILKESVTYAKQAVTLELKDAESWYVLGNAHLNSFFEGGQEYQHLDLALKAYTQSEKNQTHENPDLYHNRGTIFRYLEQYSNAISDFDKAHTIDPNLNARHKSHSIQDFVLNVCKIIKKKGTLKSDKFVKLSKSVPKSIGEIKFMKKEQPEFLTKTDENEETKDVQPLETINAIKYSVLALNTLERGINGGGVYVCKMICQLPKDLDTPICYLVVDSKLELLVLYLYHTHSGAQLKYNDTVMVRDPN
jgi:tetratricopeptide (TPR) repeat protein